MMCRCETDTSGRVTDPCGAHMQWYRERAERDREYANGKGRHIALLLVEADQTPMGLKHGRVLGNVVLAVPDRFDREAHVIPAVDALMSLVPKPNGANVKGNS